MNIGVISMGIRCPIIREGDDIANIVVDSILAATAVYNNGYDFSNVSKYSDNISEHLSYKYADVSCKSCGVQQKIFSLSKV